MTRSDTEFTALLRRMARSHLGTASAAFDQAADEIDRLRAALVKAAVMRRYKPGHDMTGEYIGLCCELCDADCGPAEQLSHTAECPLSILNPL